VADIVVTNFHQPGTTHLLLVEALLGKDLLHKVYSHALANHYRFLSYGDGMLVL
jgi:S-adenosylmethionine:tRNA ribosyltransferase-isomerase